MEQARPRTGSLCLPAGHEKIRLVLVPLGLVLGVYAGVGFFSAFKETPAAIAVGVLTTDIALHLVDLVVHAFALSKWASALSLELAVGIAAGVPFYLMFEDKAEAIAVGLMTTNIALHLAELVVERVARSAGRTPTGPSSSAGFDGPAAAVGTSS
ncbi:hypothetical protein [Streptomyces sp. NPDC047000]|uniref:hypothetical protein n=1 Tax=Streptomyces sp. NPDC047000 TaxID=3155474 RepID=UPI0033EBE4AF